MLESFKKAALAVRVSVITAISTTVLCVLLLIAIMTGVIAPAPEEEQLEAEDSTPVAPRRDF
jgi:hypothetical protein